MGKGIQYLLILAVAGAFAATFIWRGGRRWQKRSLRIMLGILLLILAAPLILFESYDPPAVTGSLTVAAKEFTWVDESRVETYADTGEKRALTIKVWYPEETGSYPLIVFSHGAFGVIDSNASTCEELASNGYVAVSIGHTYHAMFVKDVNGKVTMANGDFVRQIYMGNGKDGAEGEERIYQASREWMQVRTGDENFVLDTILEKARKKEGLFQKVDPEKIGLFGHSMGGASSVALGRMRKDIGAVIDLEGTMLGEYTGFENGSYLYEEEPYPVPLLDVNSRKAYEQAKALSGREYVNFYVGDRAACFAEIIINGAGHLNFTDLPMVSPILAKVLGVGEVDAKTCIKNVNEIVLTFFNYYLKGEGSPVLKKVY